MPPAAKAAPQKALHILIVDDNLDQVHSLAFLLSHSGHAVDYAINATVAMDLAERLQPDVIVLDVALPDGSGLDLCQRIRQFDQTTPILFYSAAAYATDHDLAMKCGAQAYLVKPTQPSELCDLVTELIEESQHTSRCARA